MEVRSEKMKEVVGAPRFELGTSCAQGRRATRLRYAPTGVSKQYKVIFPPRLSRIINADAPLRL
jgi:hypothetical protein